MIEIKFTSKLMNENELRKFKTVNNIILDYLKAINNFEFPKGFDAYKYFDIKINDKSIKNFRNKIKNQYFDIKIKDFFDYFRLMVIKKLTDKNQKVVENTQKITLELITFLYENECFYKEIDKLNFEIDGVKQLTFGSSFYSYFKSFYTNIWNVLDKIAVLFYVANEDRLNSLEPDKNADNIKYFLNSPRKILEKEDLKKIIDISFRDEFIKSKKISFDNKNVYDHFYKKTRNFFTHWPELMLNDNIEDNIAIIEIFLNDNNVNLIKSSFVYQDLKNLLIESLSYLILAINEITEL